MKSPAPPGETKTRPGGATAAGVPLSSSARVPALRTAASLIGRGVMGRRIVFSSAIKYRRGEEAAG